MNEPVLVETQALSKRYGDLVALDHCDLQVRRGEIFGLLGPNGSGKTTLIRLLMGFLRPTGGRATIDGLNCYRESVEVHRRVAYLPGDVRLFRQMRGRQLLQFFCELRPGSDLGRALAVAERLELDLSRRVAYASTGMRQKLALAASLAADVPLLMLDEPTSNLDPTVRGDVIDLVRRSQQEGRTVIFSSHVLSEVEAVCDRVAILRRGKLVHMQVMADLLRQHRIRAHVDGPLPAVPGHLADRLRIVHDGNGTVTMDTPGELSPLLGWLAQLPLSEVRIEPIGLAAVYDHYHRRSGT